MKHLKILAAFIMLASFSFNSYGQKDAKKEVKKRLNRKAATLQINRTRLAQLK